jgi:hypothetical protein
MKDQQIKKASITLDKTTEVLCECGSNQYAPTVVLRKVSKFLTGDSQDGILPIQVFSCINCKKINEDTLHPELRTKQ